MFVLLFHIQSEKGSMKQALFVQYGGDIFYKRTETMKPKSSPTQRLGVRPENSVFSFLLEKKNLVSPSSKKNPPKSGLNLREFIISYNKESRSYTAIRKSLNLCLKEVIKDLEYFHLSVLSCSEGGLVLFTVTRD